MVTIMLYIKPVVKYIIMIIGIMIYRYVTVGWSLHGFDTAGFDATQYSKSLTYNINVWRQKL